MKSVIDLIKTSQGYSVVEDGHEVNKVTSRNAKQKPYSAAPKKFTQQNFTIYPYVYCQEPEFTQKYIFVPAKSQWFNLNQIHEIQKKALPEWFKTKKVVFGAAKPDKFEKTQQLYKKYRNYIIDLARNQYLSPSAARKGLAGDVCAIIRIHSFLQKNGLINYVFPKKMEVSGSKDLQSANKMNLNLVKRKDCVDKEKTIFEKHFDKDHLQLLKKITKKVRPACHLCQGICGALWYEYNQELVLKTFEKVFEKSENLMLRVEQESEQRKAEEQKASQKIKIIKADQPFSYLFRLCSSCFTTGILPVVLSHEDFKKKTVLDNLSYHYEEPKEKKKINEQNKLIEQLEKNKFNLKKTAQILRISEHELLQLLMCLPVIKIQKLARIDPETETEDNTPNKNHQTKGTKVVEQKKVIKAEQNDEKLMEEFQKQLVNLGEEQVRLYQQLVQIWLLKVSTKMTKLSEWQKSTSWFATRLIDDQKNSLASALKQKM